MRRIQYNPDPPPSWQTLKARTPRRFLHPFLFLNWLCAHASYYLGRWAFLEVLEYLGSLSILLAVIFWFAESGQRTQQRHYQAWQVINTAQGKGGNGGRIDALRELNADHVALTGVNLADAFLQNVQLDHAELTRAEFPRADLRSAHLHHANLLLANFFSANLRSADLAAATLEDANLAETDLTAANLAGANVRGAAFDNADLSRANLANLANWRAIRSLKSANLYAVQDPPPGFLDWALAHGATQSPPP